MNELLNAAWDRAVGGLDWLKQVILGEFADHRDLSAIIADMLASFVPGVVIVTSARDLTAVILRLAKHPERRDQVEEWMLLVACAVPLVLPILAAAAGATAAGVGAVIGGIAGSEAGAVLRAVCLLLIKKGNHVLAEVVGFLRRFVKGDILKVLRDIQFVKYSDALVKYIGHFIGRLVNVIQRLRAELLKLDAFHWLADVLRKLDELERAFYAVQTSAMKAIPKALVELDIRLQQVLAEALPHTPRPVLAGVPAAPGVPVPTRPERVPAMPGNPLGHPEGTRPPGPPPRTGEGPNLHPENPREPHAASDLNAKASQDVGKVTAPIDFDGHILNAEVKPNGQVVGGHSTATGEVRVIPGTQSKPNAQGVYSAKIEVADPRNPGSFVAKTNNGGVSTMFPDAWSADRVKVEIDAAYQNRTVSGNRWSGTTPSGVKVEGFLNPKTTAYPKL